MSGIANRCSEIPCWRRPRHGNRAIPTRPVAIQPCSSLAAPWPTPEPMWRRGAASISEELGAFVQASRDVEDTRNARNARRFRNLTLALAVAVIMMGVLLGWALRSAQNATKQKTVAETKAKEAEVARIVADWETNRANRETENASQEAENARIARRQADSQRLAGEADHAIDPDTALALALAANRITTPNPPPEAALTSLVRAVFNTRAQQKLLMGAAIYAVAHHPATDRALLGGADGSLTLWDLTTGEKTKDLTGHAGTVWTAAISEDGHYALSGDSEGRLFYWDLDKGELIHQLPGHMAADGSAAGVWRALFVPPPPSETPAQQGQAAAPPRQALSAGSDGLLRLWDLQTGEESPPVSRPPRLGVQPGGQPGRDAGALRLGGWAGAAVGSERQRLWPVGGAAPRRVDAGRRLQPRRSQRALSAGGGQIKLWQLDDEVKELRAFSEGQGDVYYALGFAPDGLSFYSAGLALRRWNVERGTSTPLEGHAAAVRGLSVRSDSQGRASLLSAGLDGAAILWDLATGTLQRAYPLAAAADEGPSSAPTLQTCTRSRDLRADRRGRGGDPGPA